MGKFKRYRTILTIILIMAMILPNIVQAVTLETGEVKRLSGSSRVSTAINVSKETYKNGSNTVIISGYNGSADALTGTLLASDNNAPLLLAPSRETGLPEFIKEIERLGAKKAYILGGNAAVPSFIEAKLNDMGLDIERLSGSNRFETAVSIAERSQTKDEVFIALGKKTLPNGKEDALVDALAIGPVSAKEGKPVLLAQRDKLPISTKYAIDKFEVKRATIIGGESAITSKVKKELETMGVNVNRVSGSNRYSTANNIAKRYFKNSKSSIVASGITDTDALVGGYLGALLDSPILLTNTNKLPKETKDYIINSSKGSYVLGGESVVTDFVFKDIKKANKTTETDESNLEVHFIDVGQGDSVLIKDKNKTILIDAGERWKGDDVVNYLKNNNINKIDYLIGTHPHSDHIGGLASVINSFDIGKVIMPKVNHTSQTYENLLLTIKNKGLKITTPIVGNKYSLDDSTFTILAPNSDKYSNLNNYSVAIKLEHRNNSFVFTGDAETQSEREMLQNGLDISADVLKLGHHGSNTSSTNDFLDAVNPKYSVIQVGEKNSYGHPDDTVINKLKGRGISSYRNDLNGTIIAKSDGDKIEFSTETSKLPEEDIEDEKVPENDTVEVIRTKTGSKYHIEGCSTLRSKIPLTLKEAKGLGLEPCNVCNPPQ